MRAGSAGLRAAYERDAQQLLSTAIPTSPLSDVHIAQLPAPVQRYLRVTGAVGRPMVRTLYARMHGRIRSGRTARWMPLVAEQRNVVVEPSARMFYFDASIFGLPIRGYHRYIGSSATMQVKAAGLIPLANASGDVMTRSETVTMFNDMCVLAPAALVDSRIGWTIIDARTVKATFGNAGHSIQATLSFNDAGELVDFHSDDRCKTADDGKTLVKAHWSTPLGEYRPFACGWLASRGEARWRDVAGDYAYIELAFDDVQYNVAPPR